MLRTRARVFAITTCSVLATATGCSDAIHLDPGTGGSTASLTTGTGGGSHIGCASNADCPYPTPVCDTERGLCAECLVVSDCAQKAGTVCSKSSCVCPEKGETFCAGEAAASGACVDLQASTSDCGSCGHACYGACSSGKCADPWEQTSMVGAPAARVWHTAIWTGSVMIVWGGYGASGPLSDGAAYDPKTRTWKAIDPVGAPSARYRHTAVWDGAHGKMLVFGGTDGAHEVAAGGAYDVGKNHWSTLSTAGQPGPRQLHAATMLGAKMFVWGGESGGAAVGDGALYNAADDSWSALPGDNAPRPRRQHVAATSGAKVVVWGGFGDTEMMPDQFLADGAVYDGGTTTWATMNPSGAPSPRGFHTAAVAGGKVFIFGGKADAEPLGDGASYNLGDDTWGGLSDVAPAPRTLHTAVITGTGSASQMLVWGGQGSGGVFLASGGGLATASERWATTIPSAPQGRLGHTAVAAGSTMIIWGGQTAPGNVFTATGGVFDAAP